jgi:hypothetical protein
MHDQPFPGAGQTFVIKGGKLDGQQIVVEDWWDRVAGKSWMDCDGNPACLKYAVRSALAGLPLSDEVLYGKIGYFGELVHVSELEP